MEKTKIAKCTNFACGFSESYRKGRTEPVNYENAENFWLKCSCPFCGGRVTVKESKTA